MREKGHAPVEVHKVFLNDRLHVRTVQYCCRLFNNPLPLINDFVFHYSPNNMKKGSTTPTTDIERQRVVCGQSMDLLICFRCYYK
jgi:hypothetical protein